MAFMDTINDLDPVLFWLFFFATGVIIYFLFKTLLYIGEPLISRGLNLDFTKGGRHVLQIPKKIGMPLTLFILALFAGNLESKISRSLPFSANIELITSLANSLLIFSFGFFTYRGFKIFTLSLYKKFDIGRVDNLYQRMRLTQLKFIEKLVFAVAAVLVVGLTLAQFDRLEKLGTSLLASAGIASVIIGFAAQETVSNLFASFQIAFAQPVRFDDAVVVENEWGWVEEIHLTYIVVRLWDRRRLVLPIKYFVSQPFQNWTRHRAQIIGTVFLYLDYRANLKQIRQKFEEYIGLSNLWDRDVQVVQVVGTTEKTIKVRLLMSAKDSPTTYDLRCEIREKLLTYIQQKMPEALPTNRLNIFDSPLSTNPQSDHKLPEPRPKKESPPRA